MRSTRPLALAAAAVALGFAAFPPAPALAQDSPPSKKDRGGMRDLSELTEGMTKLDGLMPLYRYDEKDTDPTHDQTRLICVIPKNLIGDDLLLATSISRGPMRGYQWADFLVRWQQVGRQAVLTVPDMRYVEDQGKPVSAAVEGTYTPGYLASLPILGTTNDGGMIVDLGDFLISNTIPTPAGGGNARRDLSQYAKVKNFPNNMLIDVNLAIADRDGGGMPIGLSYAFRRLPNMDARDAYQPRVADDRIGYFTTVRQDFNKKYSERETVDRYVNRWQLEKLDPSLDMSPPKKPIVFIIEKTVPIQWRRYVAAGIAEWNKAYEKIGISNAIVVQQQTDDNEYKDVDPENADYNFIRWIVTGRGFAMGPSRADPRTGQILDADIIFDDAMLRFQVQDFNLFGPGGGASALTAPEAAFYKQNPSFLPLGTSVKDVELMQDAPAGTAGQVGQRGPWTLKGSNFLPAGAAEGGQTVSTTFGQFSVKNPAVSAARMAYDPSGCNYAAGLRREMAVNSLAVQAAMFKTDDGKEIPEKFIGEVIKEIVCHEVGHTLGLRHNFKASSWLSLDEIKKRRDTTDQPTTASVMDYNPVLFFPGDDPKKVGHFITPTIGPYDEWAIEYGYKIPSQKDGDEKAMLEKIATESNDPGHAYATDEDTVGVFSPDPLTNRYDMGSDPVAWAEMRTKLADGLLKDVTKWAIQPEDSQSYLREVFLTLFYERTSNYGYVSRLIGGQYYNRNHPGQKGAKPAMELVDPKVQRAALDEMAKTVFSDDYYKIDPALLKNLVPDRNDDWTATAADRIDFPVHTLILNAQNQALRALVDPTVMQRIYDAELKSDAKDKFTAAELLQRVDGMIWGDLKPSDKTYTNAEPMISSIRRNLQKQQVEYLLASADAEPGRILSVDLQSLVRFDLRELSDRIGNLIDKSKADGKSRLDLATRAHLTETKSRIDRVLEAPHIRDTGGGMTVIMMNGQPAR